MVSITIDLRDFKKGDKLILKGEKQNLIVVYDAEEKQELTATLA